MLLGTQAYSSVTRPMYNTVSAAQNHKQQLFVTEIIMHSELHNCSFILDTGLKCTTFILLCSFTSAVEIQDRQTSFNIWGTKNFNPYRFSGRSEPRGPMIRMRAYCISFFFFFKSRYYYYYFFVIPIFQITFITFKVQGESIDYNMLFNISWTLLLVN